MPVDCLAVDLNDLYLVAGVEMLQIYCLKFRNDTTCVQSCPAGTALVDSLCEKCPAGCLACSQPGTCAACIEGFLDSSAQCVPGCVFPYFNDPATLRCLLCTKLLDQEYRTCTDECPFGKFASGAVCLSCRDNCVLCYSLEYCAGCSNVQVSTGLLHKDD